MLLANRQEVFENYSTLPMETKMDIAFRNAQSNLWGGQEHTLTGLLPDIQFFASTSS